MTMTGVTTLQTVAELGRQLRVQSILLADRAGSGHPTSSMSAADLVAVLVARHLRVDPAQPDAIGNDRLVFSKGHASPLLYATLDAIGVLEGIDGDGIDSYRLRGSILEGHPTPLVPGVPVATGSLGIGLPAGMGLALTARDLDRTDAHVWVLCGDSELSEGSMWEAVEHAGWASLSNLTAIVDINRLGQTGPTRHGWDLPAYRERFAAFGWEATLVDGHDVGEIDQALEEARRSTRPTAVLARTHKGSGASEADDVDGRHGKPLEDPQRAIEELGGRRTVHIEPPRPAAQADRPAMSATEPPRLPEWSLGDEVATRTAFGEAIAALGQARGDLVALDGEVGDSTRLDRFRDVVGERFFQLYISEQLMISVATAMQTSGWRPVAATFAAFATRAHDQLRMATIGRANFCLVGSHAGVSIGPDGPSQMGLEDLAMMRALHDSTVLYPCDANQTAALTSAMIDHVGITYLRTTRGNSPVIYGADERFHIGGSRVLRESTADVVTLIGAGVTVHEAVEAADRLGRAGIAARVIDAFSVKPLDRAGLVRAAAETGNLVVAEDHRPEGGLGEAVLAELAEAGAGMARVRHLAVRRMPGSAQPGEQLHDAEIDADAITRAARQLLDTAQGAD